MATSSTEHPAEADIATTIGDIEMLQSNLERWLSDLGEVDPAPDSMSTSFYGPVGKGGEGLGKVLIGLVAAVQVQPAGAEVVRRMVKDVNRATHGQLVNILEAADKERCFGSRRLLKRPEQLAHAVSLRNAWAHGRGGRSIQDARDILLALRGACDELMVVAQALQDPV